MAAGSDYLIHVNLDTGDTDLILTVYFLGGPVSGFVSVGGDQKPFSFAADPFFRKQDNYVASGSVYIPTVAGGQRLRAISVLFTNASGSAAEHRIELSSPRQLTVAATPGATEVKPGIASPARLFAKFGSIPAKESVQYSLVVEHP